MRGGQKCKFFPIFWRAALEWELCNGGETTILLELLKHKQQYNTFFHSTNTFHNICSVYSSKSPTFNHLSENTIYSTNSLIYQYTVQLCSYHNQPSQSANTQHTTVHITTAWCQFFLSTKSLNPNTQWPTWDGELLYCVMWWSCY